MANIKKVNTSVVWLSKQRLRSLWSTNCTF